jgi:hypothetical protein
MDDADIQKDDLIDLQSKALLKQGFANQNSCLPSFGKESSFSLDPICYNVSLRIWIFSIGQCEDIGWMPGMTFAQHCPRLSVEFLSKLTERNNNHLIKVVLKNF